MNNCKTCKWWGKNILQNVYAECYPEHKICKVKSPKLEITCMSEGIDGEMWTKEDFGCVLYESEAGNGR